MFTLRVKDKFSAAHQLVGYRGDCANLHGHTWKVEVVLVGDQLDQLNMLIDFRRIKRLITYTLDPLDHVCLNDVHRLGTDIPTAEYISRYLFNTIAHGMAELQFPQGIALKEVTVWESDSTGVTYSKDVGNKSRSSEK